MTGMPTSTYGPRRHRGDGLSMSSYAVARLAGITYRQLDHWIRTGIVDLPTAHPTGYGPGNHRRFTEAEADLIVKVAAEKRHLDERFAVWQSGQFWREVSL